MPRWFPKSALAALLVLPSFLCAQSRIEDRKSPADETGKDGKPGKSAGGKPGAGGRRTVWNLDGGVFFSTDGHLPNGSCFRLSGEMNAPGFFDGLKRIDDSDETEFQLRNKVVTEYPNEVRLAIHILDFPCTLDLKDPAVRPPLTREMMSTLRLNFRWKDGITLHQVESAKRTSATLRQLAPYSSTAGDLAPRYEWNYTFAVGSEGVPLTRQLVIIMETSDGKIAARVAAKL
jgi:hypothetical protein